MIRGASWVSNLARGMAVTAAAALALVSGLAQPAQADDPIKLTLAMTSLNVSGSKPSDTVTVKFTLTNTGTVPAYGVVAHLWRSRDPIRDRSALQTVANGGQTLGSWVDGAGAYQLVTNSVTAFEPGASKQFTLTAKLSHLGFDVRGAAYAFGADVVATADQSSNNAVVAKVRTFIPLPAKSRVPVTTVVLLSAAPTKLADNVFANDTLTAELTGRLGALLTAAAQPGRGWLVDPALIDEVRDQADGYQVFDGTTTQPGTGQQVAADWLARFSKLNPDQGARTLFGNPDTAGATATGHDSVMAWSKAATAAVGDLDDLPLIVVPTGGLATNATFNTFGNADATAVLATNNRHPGALLRSHTALPVVANSWVSTSQASADPTVAITQRQLNLAQTAICGKAGQLRLLSTAADLSSEAAVRPSWVTERDLGTLLTSRPSGNAELMSAKPNQLSDQQFASVNRLSADVNLYSELVPDSALISHPEAAYLRTIAQAWISDPAQADSYSDRMAELIGRQAVSGRIHLTVSSRFLMSARSNQFPVTVTNDSLEPVRVRVVVTSDNPQRLTVPPSELITVNPGQSETVNIRPEATGNGLIQASAHLTTDSGRRLSSDVPVTIEVTELGMVAWIIVAVSGVVLVGATAWRIRQVRRRNFVEAPPTDPVEEP